MYSNVESFSNVPASFMEYPAAQQASGEYAVNEGTVGVWNEEKGMMFFGTPGTYASTSAPVQINGCTYYAQPASEYGSPAGSLVNGCSSSEDDLSIEESQQSCFYPMTEAPRSVEFCGTTYYYTATYDQQHGSYYGSMDYDSDDERSQQSEVQHEMFHSEAIRVTGTTYFWPSFSSTCSSSEEFSSFPQEDFSDEYEIDGPLKIVDDLVTIYETFQKWIPSEDEMREAGYSAIDENGSVRIKPTQWERNTKTWIDREELSRHCSRCRKNFVVGAGGRFPTGEGICQYETKGQWTSANMHITSQRFTSELEQFVATLAPAGEEDCRSYQIYAIDVEMVATTAGPALARVSVVDFTGKLQLDVFVRPEAEVVDCLTEFSGITKEMLETATHNLESCRDLLFKLINAKSILIGHGLESDLKALRLVHRNVIDSSIMYLDDRKRKVALRKLAKQYLDRTIQADNPTTFAHCSEEDALASLDLVKHRINFC